MVQAYYDDLPFELSDDFKAALIKIMQAMCEMMSQQDSEHSDCWYWGRCRVGNLATTNGLSFEYGGEEDLPDDDLGHFAVLESSWVVMKRLVAKAVRRRDEYPQT